MRTAYSSSKWAVVGFTKSLAIELGEAGIRVNAIQPGIVEGERIRRVFEAKAKARDISFEQMRDEALSMVSMRTAVTPQQLADAILFICSPRGRTISGQAISICGDTQMLAEQPRGIIRHAAAVASATGCRYSFSRGSTSLANSVRLSTVSSWTRKPAWPIISRLPMPPQYSQNSTSCS